MEIQDRKKLLSFLAMTPDDFCDIVIPTFIGMPGYAGAMHTNRDVRGAMLIAGLMGDVAGHESVHHPRDPEEWYNGADDHARVAFLFGSKTNEAVRDQLRLEYSPVEVSFNKKYPDQNHWCIATEKNKYSIIDPVAHPSSYEMNSDYGVVVRTRNRNMGCTMIMFAGLGGRATEGCAFFFVNCWRIMQTMWEESEKETIAVVLEFPALSDPGGFQIVEKIF